MDGRTDGWMDEEQGIAAPSLCSFSSSRPLINGHPFAEHLSSGVVDGLLVVVDGGWKNFWADGWMDERTVGWIDEWMEENMK